jgi:CDP-diacylglycerol--glycerol-3-phosphate 3-phosphatidyltransferase
MISKYGRQAFALPVTYTASLLRRLGFTPNGLTYTGFFLTIVSAGFLAAGLFFWGGLILLVAAFFDMLDGALARTTEQSSAFGAFLDSTLDRYSESVTFLGLVFYYASQGTARTEIVLIFVIIVGSMMVSYTRARAEALQLDCKVGILQRPERVLLLIASLLIGWVMPVLWVLAIMTNVTAVQRIYEVYVQTVQVQTHGQSTGKGVAKRNDNQPV